MRRHPLFVTPGFGSAFFGLVFFDLAFPFFGAIPQIRLGFGSGGYYGCESRNARALEEDEVAKVEAWGAAAQL